MWRHTDDRQDGIRVTTSLAKDVTLLADDVNFHEQSLADCTVGSE